MTTTPEIMPARASDLDHVRRLLLLAGLPGEDIDARSMDDFLVARDERGELLAAGAVERYESDGLLRSVVVNEAARGTGLGVAMVNALEDRAREHRIRNLYLLTMTAAQFFPRLGYVRIARDAVPSAVAASEEFASLCPASADCFHKLL